MKKTILICVVFFLCSCQMQKAENDTIEKAELFMKHHLNEDAKRVLINIISENMGGEEEIPKAYYLLGKIAFNENNLTLAVDTWADLKTKFPQSKQSAFVENQVKDLSDIAGSFHKELFNNTLAQNYLSNADFWSNDRDSVFRVDSSSIPKVEASIKWYDKTLAEFPKSPEAKQAYQNKLRTLIGWKDSGQYGYSYGMKDSRQFDKYMTMYLETLASFEKDFPQESSLQGFRYQAAQAYWYKDNNEKAREWLNVIINKASNEDNFYKDLAQRRLENLY